MKLNRKNVFKVFAVGIIWVVVNAIVMGIIKPHFVINFTWSALSAFIVCSVAIKHWDIFKANRAIGGELT